MKRRAIDVLAELLSGEDDVLETLVGRLPHGSGIDADWHTDVLKNGNVVLSCSYHGMNDAGYYDGWQDFSVVLFCHQRDVVNKLKGPCEGQVQVLYRAGDLDFRVVLNGYRMKRSWAYDLKGYLSETIGYALSEMGIGKMRCETLPA